MNYKSTLALCALFGFISSSQMVNGQELSNLEDNVIDKLIEIQEDESEAEDEAMNAEEELFDLEEEFLEKKFSLKDRFFELKDALDAIPEEELGEAAKKAVDMAEELSLDLENQLKFKEAQKEFRK